MRRRSVTNPGDTAGSVNGGQADGGGSGLLAGGNADGSAGTGRDTAQQDPPAAAGGQAGQAAQGSAAHAGPAAQLGTAVAPVALPAGPRGTRPFTNNSRIGMLSTSYVPTEFKGLHSTLLDLRHKAFAHTDASGRLPGHGMMTEVRLVYEGESVVNFSSRPILEPVLLPQIKTLSDILAQKVKEVHDTFYDRVLGAILPMFGKADVGKEFVLNVQDEKGPMVVLSEDPIQHRYPVVRHLAGST